MLNILQTRLRYNERRLERVVAAPTVPLYNHDAVYPQEAIEGQIAVDNELETITWYSNGVWRTEVTEFVDIGTFSGFFSAGVVTNPAQDILDGQIFVGNNGAILISLFSNFLRIKTELVSPRPSSIPQDTIAGQIVVGADDKLYCTPDGINWYRSTRTFILGFTTIEYTNHGTPADSLIASIYTDISNVPGTLLASLTGSTAFGNADFDYGNSFKLNLVQGVKYWLVLERNGGLNSSNYYGIKTDTSDTGRVATFNGSTWTVSIASKISAIWQWFTASNSMVVTPDLGFGGFPLGGGGEMPLGNIAANSKIAVQIGY